MINLKKLFASVMALAMVATVAPVKVDAATVAKPTVCTITDKAYIETVEDYVAELLEVIDLETVKKDDEFVFRSNGEDVKLADVLAVTYDWDLAGTGTEKTLQAALTEIAAANCGSEELVYLAGLVKGAEDLGTLLTDKYNTYIKEDAGKLVYNFETHIDTKDKGIAMITELQTLINALTNPVTTNYLVYAGNVEGAEDTIDAIVEAAEEAIDVIVETYDIELASDYYNKLVAYLRDTEKLIETTTSSVTGTLSVEVITIDEFVEETAPGSEVYVSRWEAAGKKTGTTYYLEQLISKIENDKLTGIKGYEDFEEEVADIMEGLEALLEASEALDELVEDVKALEANSKVGKSLVLEAKALYAAADKNTYWDEVFADATLAELYAEINPAQFEMLAEIVELVEEEFYSMVYTKKGSRWLTKVDATENYPHMAKVFAAAGTNGVALPKLADLFAQYVDTTTGVEVKTELTNWDVLVEYIAGVEADYEAVTEGIKGITVNNLSSKNIDAVLEAREALARLQDVETADEDGYINNLTDAEVKAVKANVENINVLYLKALFGGVTTAKTTGWVDLGNGNWDYYGEDGNVFTGWVAAGSNWYYVSNGHMLRNTWVAKDATGAVWYYLGTDGAMVSNTTVDGYYINANGEWVK